MSLLTAVLSLVSGGIVGFALGMSGGGGSILAVPLLLYVVGVPDPHVAIGTSALAVAVNAFANVIGHWRSGTVKWPCATVFAGAGAVGAAIGSTLGKLTNGSVLLVLFALAMFAVGAAMLRPRMASGDPTVRLDARIAGRLAGIGALTGGISGFFGIGGGFLIVPGIMLGSGMPILNAIGSSLVSVGVFGITTAANYALAGLVAWQIAGVFILGGVGGGILGMRTAIALAARKAVLSRLFAGMVLVVATYMLVRSAFALLH
ncbi:MAG: sulfite exporter TauE/SafE family protein [Alphaproteobacteria bacterium]|nr:sulfite exporter TauE/SafE family protein [Alphaproteobacteria bacterium]